MSIKKSVKGKDLIGKKVSFKRDIHNGAGQGVQAETTIGTIASVKQRAGISIKTDYCPHCGQYAYITGVDRGDLTLLEEE